MRIGILTQPLRSNYGGILQNWALQQVLRRMGHEPITISYALYSVRQRIVIGLNWFLSILNPFSRSKDAKLPNWDKKYFPHHINFARKHITCTGGFFTCDRRRWARDNFDAYIVGSDQVWRPMYNWYPGAVMGMYGKYIPSDYKGRLVSYAASFGVDSWEYTDAQTREIRTLIKRFNSISVREKSGIMLCREYLDRNAVQVLDPTLLLNKTDYITLVDKDIIESVPKGRIGVYILDKSEEKLRFVNQKATELGLPALYFGLTDYPSVKDSIERWLASFYNCDYIITDSFHGTVFSIIFNKPFAVIKNDKRGNARIDSLLSLLGFEYDNLSANIDWNETMHKINALRERSIDFLKQSLGC